MINIRKQLKRAVNLVYRIKRWPYIKTDSDKYKLHRYGNNYGGFMVYDEDLKKSPHPIIYSFGIGEDLSFSEELMNTFSPEIYAFDPTPKAIQFVKNHELSKNSSFHFSPIGLSDKDETTTFFIKPEGAKDVSGSVIPRKNLMKEGIEVNMECIKTISKKNGHTYIDLLKMDVEGSEFKVVEGLKECDVAINQICLELHDRFFNDGIKLLKELLATMRSMGYILISVSGKKDELTFLKKG